MHPDKLAGFWVRSMTGEHPTPEQLHRAKIARSRQGVEDFPLFRLVVACCKIVRTDTAKRSQLTLF